MAEKTCPQGHKFLKSSDCPVCPECEAARTPTSAFHAAVGAPARRALEREGIDTLAKLSTWTVPQVLALHGLGPSSIPKLAEQLAKAGRSFRGT